MAGFEWETEGGKGLLWISIKERFGKKKGFWLAEISSF